MNLAQVDFSPLQKFASTFRFFRIVKRVKMIIVRLTILAIIIAVAWGAFWLISRINAATDAIEAGATMSETTSETHSYSSSGSYDLSLLFFISIVTYFGSGPLLMILLSQSWARFAMQNEFQEISDINTMKALLEVPGFKDKIVALKLPPIGGRLNDIDFVFFMRMYKEGGIIRWRERRMDTIIRTQLPVNLPHIVINATANENLRRTNMTDKPVESEVFQFEGPLGKNYDVYAARQNQIIALQLFTPDVLEILYDELPRADVIIKDNNMWVLFRGQVASDENTSRLFHAIATFHPQIAKQAASLA